MKTPSCSVSRPPVRPLGLAALLCCLPWAPPAVADNANTLAAVEVTRYVERPDNVGDAHFWGLELDWRVPLLRRGPHDLTLTGNYS